MYMMFTSMSVEMGKDIYLGIEICSFTISANKDLDLFSLAMEFQPFFVTKDQYKCF